MFTYLIYKEMTNEFYSKNLTKEELKNWKFACIIYMTFSIIIDLILFPITLIFLVKG